MEVSLDPTHLAILRLLQENARLSLAEIGRQVGLSAPAVAERVRRLEDAGIILGYRAELDLEALGYGVEAIIELTTPASRYPEALAQLRRLPAVRSCRHVSGDTAFQIGIVVASVSELERVIAALSPLGETSTRLVLSTPVSKPRWQAP